MGRVVVSRQTGVAAVGVEATLPPRDWRSRRSHERRSEAMARARGRTRVRGGARAETPHDRSVGRLWRTGCRRCASGRCADARNQRSTWCDETPSGSPSRAAAPACPIVALRGIRSAVCGDAAHRHHRARHRQRQRHRPGPHRRHRPVPRRLRDRAAAADGAGGGGGDAGVSSSRSRIALRGATLAPSREEAGMASGVVGWQ